MSITVNKANASSRSTAITPPRPNFFIVGASRAGSTSMYEYLRQHPDIFMPARRWAEKEPSHFCDLTPFWAVKYRDFDTYLELFEAAEDKKAIGEASVNYLISPESPARIRNQFPDAKIIIMLRHPVSRAYSLYRFMCSRGAEWISPFEKALAEEKNRHQDEYFMHHNPFYYYGYLYFNSGLYSTQIERYQSEFPAEQVHFVLFDDLKKNTIETVQRIYEFLGVRSNFIPQIATHNQSRQPYSVYAQYFIFNILGGYLAKAKVPKNAIGFVSGIGSRINLRLGKMFPRTLKGDTYEKLLALYKEDILKTAELSKLDLGAWFK